MTGVTESSKYVEILTYLYKAEPADRYMVKIAQGTDSAYSHMLSLLRVMQDEKLIKTTKGKKERFVRLTEKGMALAFYHSLARITEGRRNWRSLIPEKMLPSEVDHDIMRSLQ